MKVSVKKVSSHQQFINKKKTLIADTKKWLNGYKLKSTLMTKGEYVTIVPKLFLERYIVIKFQDIIKLNYFLYFFLTKIRQK